MKCSIQKIIIIIVLSNTLKIYAQDVHYWAQTYGAESTLLGGAVLGSVNDLGATYYNPGKLSLTENPNFLFSARIFEYAALTLKPKDVTVEGVSESYLRPSPAFIVYNLSADWLGKHKVAFSLLSRHTFDVRLKTRFVGNIESTDVSNEIIYEGDVGQYWVGITWSYPFTKGKNGFGVGITNYFAIRNYRSRNSVNIQTADTSNSVSIFSAVSEYDYYNVGILWKAGIGYTFEKIRFGLTVTTPSLNLMGSGDVDVNVNSSGMDLDGDEQPDKFLASNYQTDISSHYKSSLALGLGIYYKFSSFKVHLAGEYFFGLDKFNVLNSNSFQSQTGDLTLENDLTHALKPVFNYGVGMEYFINEQVTTYAAFTTDHSALDTDENSNHSFLSWNYYHITAGAAVSIKEFELTFGLSLAIAEDDIYVPIFPLSESEEVDFIFQRQEAEVSSNRLKVILGFTF